MLGHLIRKEILDQILGLRFVILAVIGTIIIWLSLFIGHDDFVHRMEDYRIAQAATNERIRQIMEADDWWEVLAAGFVEHKPPIPMSLFVRGLEPVMGRSISNAESSAQRLRQSPTEAEPILGLYPHLDLESVVRVILSLFMLILTYDALCGEKESGTLRLTASFPVQRHFILLSKILGAYIPSMVVFTLPLFIGIIGMVILTDVHFTFEDWMYLGLTILIFLIYLAVFICAGLFASSVSSRPSTSFVLLLTFWVLVVVVLPRLSLIVAETIRPAPSIHKHQAERKAISKSFLIQWREYRAAWNEAYQQRTGKAWWASPEGREAERHMAVQGRKTIYDQRWPAVARLDEKFRNQYERRHNLAIALAGLSPAFALKNAAVSLTGTGIDRHHHFESAFINDYFMALFRPWYWETSERYYLKAAHPQKYGKPVWELSDMPRFSYSGHAVQRVSQKILIDVGIMILWGLCLFLGAFLFFLRYDVR